LGQHFSKVFDIKFIGEDEKEHYVWQTSWGISTRLIGALVMVHGDDRGLVLPPAIAPVQVVIVPIPFKGKEKEQIQGKAQEILQRLQKRDLSVVLDDRAEYTPGWKFNEWEMKGVPVRIEIGPRDVKQNQVTVARRDTFERTAIKDSEIEETTAKMLKDIQNNIYNRAKKLLEENITTVEDYEEFRNTLKKKGGFMRASWCSNSSCEEKIKQETGATIRVVPFEKEKIFSKCLYCGGEAKEVVYFAKAY
jgi:prolyl-tRNA synthetase